MVSSETFCDSLRNADETEDMCHDRDIVHHNLTFFAGAHRRTCGLDTGVFT
jgi:hypothetical protein